MFPQNTPDSEWITIAGQRGWIAFTKDRDIRTNVLERVAVVNARARLFSLARGDLTAEDMAAVFVAARREMSRTIRRYPAPFYARLTRSGEQSALFLEADLREVPARRQRP